MLAFQFPLAVVRTPTTTGSSSSSSSSSSIRSSKMAASTVGAPPLTLRPSQTGPRAYGPEAVRPLTAAVVEGRGLTSREEEEEEEEEEEADPTARPVATPPQSRALSVGSVPSTLRPALEVLASLYQLKSPPPLMVCSLLTTLCHCLMMSDPASRYNILLYYMCVIYVRKLSSCLLSLLLLRNYSSCFQR